MRGNGLAALHLARLNRDRRRARHRCAAHTPHPPILPPPSPRRGEGTDPDEMVEVAPHQFVNRRSLKRLSEST